MKKIALVFPGQGSQVVGMLSEHANNAIVQATFNIATQVLNYDLWQLTQQGPEERLNQTTQTQPALLTAGVALWRIWQQQIGIIPTLLAGHSLGEYTALVCAEVLTFEDAIQLVAERGRIMQEAIPVNQGAMAAIVGLEETQVTAICMEASNGAVLQPANYNSVGQIVIAGETAAVKRALELAKNQGAKIAKLLAVSIPAHCQLMQDAAKHLQEKLNDINFSIPKIPVIHNADVAIYNDCSKIKDALVRQLYSPVHWVETIRMMQNCGIEGIFECGPGNVLNGLNKRIAKGIILNTLGLPQTLQEVIASVKREE